jgi:hypothetical protein
MTYAYGQPFLAQSVYQPGIATRRIYTVTTMTEYGNKNEKKKKKKLHHFQTD